MHYAITITVHNTVQCNTRREIFLQHSSINPQGSVDLDMVPSQEILRDCLE